MILYFIEMEEFKGTKAPWVWQKFGYATYLTAQHGMREIIIGSINDVPAMNVDGILRRVDTDHPNAKLIAAAPDLLEALQDTDKDLCVLETTMAQIEKSDNKAEGMVDLVQKWRKRNKEAINKALGK